MEIGKLSAKYESNGDPGAIGFDAGGGWSYGTNQIATKTGTFGFFMDFCKQRFPVIHGKLETAGGFKAASTGTDAFKAAWKAVANELKEDFKRCQHEFIVETQYGTTIKRLKSANIDLASPPRTNTLADVIYSLAVMAGPGVAKANGSGCCGLVFDALTKASGLNGSLPDDKIIEVLYAEKLSRIDTGREYKGQNDQIRASVRKRVVNEHVDAVKMLAVELKPAP